MTQPLLGQRSRVELIAELYDRHAAGLFAYSHDQLGDADSASDVLVAVLSGVSDTEPPRAALYALARREIFLRDIVYSPPVTGLDPAAALVDRVLSDLRTHQREVLYLSGVCEMDASELSWVLDVAVDTADELTVSACRRFAQSLGRALASAKVPEHMSEVFGALAVAPVRDVLNLAPWATPPARLRAAVLGPKAPPAASAGRSTSPLFRQLWPTTPAWPLPLAQTGPPIGASDFPVPDHMVEDRFPDPFAPRDPDAVSTHEATTEPMPRLGNAVLTALDTAALRPRRRLQRPRPRRAAPPAPVSGDVLDEPPARGDLFRPLSPEARAARARTDRLVAAAPRTETSPTETPQAPHQETAQAPHAETSQSSFAETSLTPHPDAPQAPAPLSAPAPHTEVSHPPLGAPYLETPQLSFAEISLLFPPRPPRAPFTRSGKSTESTEASPAPSAESLRTPSAETLRAPFVESPRRPEATPLTGFPPHGNGDVLDDVLDDGPGDVLGGHLGDVLDDTPPLPGWPLQTDQLDALADRERRSSASAHAREADSSSVRQTGASSARGADPSPAREATPSSAPSARGGGRHALAGDDDRSHFSLPDWTRRAERGESAASSVPPAGRAQPSFPAWATRNADPVRSSAVDWFADADPAKPAPSEPAPSGTATAAPSDATTAATAASFDAQTPEAPTALPAWTPRTDHLRTPTGRAQLRLPRWVMRENQQPDDASLPSAPPNHALTPYETARDDAATTMPGNGFAAIPPMPSTRTETGADEAAPSLSDRAATLERRNGRAPRSHKATKSAAHHDWAWEVIGFVIAVTIAMIVFFAVPMMTTP
ncbi:hypothetical protein ABT352_25865 [Streptosporangium sp. NPDC000563]|uniref:hypothetical protein n=1 Tax=Streptosporangium sp. NPDC000563 TaxID=3154366 RepID=UPI00332DEF01